MGAECKDAKDILKIRRLNIFSPCTYTASLSASLEDLLFIAPDLDIYNREQSD